MCERRALKQPHSLRLRILAFEDPLVRGHGISKKDISVLVDDMIVNTSRYLPECWN